jgi:oxygen-independent coproporphyrinogen-3 oxidase
MATSPVTAPPLGLYVHLPWCVRKCPYCDFNSHGARGAIPESAYVDALLADLAGEAQGLTGRVLQSVFLGGGTPSLFGPEAIARLLASIRRGIRCAPDMEVTLEANPGTVERGRFAHYRAAGVNRLSIGVQSFDDTLLARIGRIHTGTNAQRAAEAAHGAGFGNLNLDLMYGLPGQTPEQARADVVRACALSPRHISHYELTIEPHTPFGRQPPRLPDEANLTTMLTRCQEVLARHGFMQYEVSAYAQPGQRCRHNLNYWTFGDYLGIGAGAHSKLSEPRQGRVRRLWRRKHPSDYLGHRGGAGWMAGARTLSADDLRLEFMMNALRLIDGVPTDLYCARTGLGRDSLTRFRRLAEARELLAANPERLVPTELGRRFLDDLLGLAV